MNNSPRKLINFLLVILMVSSVFGVGYFIGKVDRNNILNYSYDLNASVSDSIDLEPFLRVWRMIDEKYVSDSGNVPSDEDRIYGAIKGMVETLEDPYTVFLTPKETEEFESMISGNFEGVGMEVGIRDDVLTVIAPLKNTPAERAGVKAGDKIISIDGQTSQNLSIDEAVGKIRGPLGTKVEIEVVREGTEEPIKISITRDRITIPVLDYEIKDDVFVISLYNFSANSSFEFRNTLREFVLSGKDKLILDMRGNPGGYLESAVEIASWFLPQGKIIVKEDFGSNKEAKNFRSKGYDIFNKDLKMMVLINEGSASASEIVAGALQYHNVAKVLGTNSFGKGSVQELVPVTSLTSLKITIAQWLTPGGRSISDGGLTPDYRIDNSPEGIELYDYQLSEAIRILKE